MNERVFLTFNLGSKRRDEVIAIAEECECPEAVKPLTGLPYFGGMFELDCESSDPRLRTIRALLANRGIHWNERVDRQYTRDELRRAPLLLLSVDRRSIDGGDPGRGTEYDVSTGCPACGTGATQVSPLTVVARELPKRGALVALHTGQIICREDLAARIRSSGLSGIELRQAYSVSKRRPLPWWQLVAQQTLPRMSSRTLGVVRSEAPGWGCLVCKRDMHSHETRVPTQIAYDVCNVRVEQLPDIMVTWECFGRSVLKPDPERQLVAGYAQPSMIVKPKVMELLDALQVREAHYEPVEVIGD